MVNPVTNHWISGYLHIVSPHFFRPNMTKHGFTWPTWPPVHRGNGPEQDYLMLGGVLFFLPKMMALAESLLLIDSIY